MTVWNKQVNYEGISDSTLSDRWKSVDESNHTKSA